MFGLFTKSSKAEAYDLLAQQYNIVLAENKEWRDHNARLAAKLKEALVLIESAPIRIAMKDHKP